MATAKVNGVRLFYELFGAGETPLVLVSLPRIDYRFYRKAR
jgi:hypothetical protein